MKKASLVVVILILSGQRIYSQPDKSAYPNLSYCVKTNSLTWHSLKNIYPFDKTAKIQLVSFKPDLTNESAPMKDGVIDTTQFIETKTLNRAQENGLIDILYNYGFDPKVKKDSIVVMTAMCYEPRNAVIFRNNKGGIVTYLEICFECLGHKSLKNDLPIVFCQDKYDLLKRYFGRIGIKFGVTEHE